MSELLDKVVRNGFWITPAGSVTDEWIQKNHLLVCKGIINWHLFAGEEGDPRTPRHKMVITKWKEKHDEYGNIKK